MSRITFTAPIPRLGLGFTTEGSGVPLYGLGQANGGSVVAEDLQRKYQEVRDWCNENLGPEACNSFLPRSVYNAIGQPRESRLPWWAWMLLGALAGRMLRV